MDGEKYRKNKTDDTFPSTLHKSLSSGIPQMLCRDIDDLTMC